MQNLIGILLLAPLLGFLFNGIRYKSQNAVLAGIVASGAALVSFVCSVILLCQLVQHPNTSIQVEFFPWINWEQLNIGAAFLVDQISIIMLLVITGVGSLIHIFSIGYMSHDDRPSKYFSYLNLFLFNMLVLVLGDNLLVMFVGWEGVGLCSYLLIGFWFKDSAKAAAGMKAFVTNRIGDAGFLIGMFIIFHLVGSLKFSELPYLLQTYMGEASFELGWSGPITLACLFLFVGASGKSAQIPLYVWLPDAMAGPTPVSALIHAATMVTAGVYMIIRMNGVFMMAPNAMLVIAIIGGLTALIAATIGLAQWDIKKVLAYSTVSQLGYMFLAVGVGAFMPALFHLMTHAFFKALMFLGSGSVIHAMGDEQDIRKMGGLKKKLPVTYFTFLMGYLAIIGIPPLAGFFSKDEILWYALRSPQGHWSFWVMGILGALCTAFYMTRLMALVFWGKSRVPKDVSPHESPLVMTGPLMILAGLAVVGGWIGIPHAISGLLPGHPPNILEHWLESSLVPLSMPHSSVVLELSLMALSVSAVVIVALFAYQTYVTHPDEWPKKMASKFGPLHGWVANKYFVDEFYFEKVINPLIKMSQGLWAYIDVNFIDKTTYTLSNFVKNSGQALKSLQTGNMQQYALYITMGLLGIIYYLLVG